MKECTSCLVEMELNNFSPQRKHPGKIYAWCDDCRELAKEAKFALMRSRSYSSEISLLKSKAESLRRLNDAQSAEVKRRKRNGEAVSMLAREFKVSETTIYKELRRTA